MNRTSVEPVPMSGPDITESELASVAQTLRTGCLSIGPQLEAFEHAVARRARVKHAIGVSSGTAGLHLAVIDAGVEAGDFVITTPFSFVASANCVLYERGIPIFVDVDPLTGNIDAALAAAAIRDLRAGGPRRQRWLPPALRQAASLGGTLKAVLPVHAFGQPADMDLMLEAAHCEGVKIIEDACEAIGAEYKGQMAGGIGDTGVFAFYPNKQVTTGEGGMIVTNRDDSAALFRSLRNQGRDTMNAWLTHDRLGYNYRLDELSAALGGAQVARLEQLLDRRERVSGWYTDRLAAITGISTPWIDSSVTRMSWFVYVIRLDAYLDRGAIMADLLDQGVPSRPYFSPIHLQPFYAASFGYRPGDFPSTEALGASGLALPFSGTMTEAQVDRVCAALIAAVDRESGRADYAHHAPVQRMGHGRA